MRLACVAILLCFVFSMAAEAVDEEYELSLFNSSGEATAYITGDSTIYLWAGKPVAYLIEDEQGFHVYGFNGKHLGWFDRGAIWDHSGKAVGAVEDIFDIPVSAESFKDYRQYKPLKAMKETPPVRPVFTEEWSDLSFRDFLMQGASSE